MPNELLIIFNAGIRRNTYFIRFDGERDDERPSLLVFKSSREMSALGLLTQQCAGSQNLPRMRKLARRVTQRAIQRDHTVQRNHLSDAHHYFMAHAVIAT